VTIQMAGTITNTDGLPQAGTVCLELVGSGSCGGTSFSGGSWQYIWDDANLPPGDYLVRVSSSTMDGTSRWYQSGNPSGTAVKGDATPVSLGDGQPDFSFTMVMPAIAKLSGRVVTTSGDGVSGVPVIVNTLGVVRSTTSGANGVYDFGYTRPGPATISVNGSATYAGDQQSVVVPGSGAFVMDDLVLTVPATISGRVTDAVTGQPVPFIDVFAFFAASPHNYVTNTTTDADGRYSLEGLGIKPLVVRFTDWAHSGYEATLNNGGDPVTYSPSTPIELEEGADLVLDQELTPTDPVAPGPHNLSGTVTDDSGRPLAGIEVSFGGSGDTTDRKGAWTIDAPDGTHPVTFTPGGAWSTAFGSEPTWAGASLGPVTVSGGVGASDLDVTLVRLVANTTLPTVTGVPQPGRTLTATTGAWTAPTGTTFATAWLRGGTVVGSGATYVVRPADAGAALVARVTATYGQAVVPASSAALSVPRLVSTVVARGSSPAAGKVRIRVRVKAPGLTPTGTVDVRRGRKVVKRDVPLRAGRAVVVLTRQPAGSARYRVLFDGSPQTLPSRSKAVQVSVV
jgi:hypothetical protein